MHALLEGGAEGAVTVVTTLLGQLLCDDGFMCSGKFAVAGYEVTDAKVVDVCIVACALTGEILAEIVVVNADGCRELRQGQVLLQIELRVLAVLRQQFANSRPTFGSLTLLILPVIILLLRREGQGGEALQCLHAPQQEARQRESDEMGDGGHHVVVGIFKAHEQYHEADEQCKAEPHLLVLQVGVVVAQPQPVLSHGHHHIYNVGHGDDQPIDHVRGREVDVGQGCLKHCDHRAGCHDDYNGPQRSAAVLQHVQQCADEDGGQHHAVDSDEQPVNHRTGVVRVSIEQYPPDVGQSHHAE